MATENLGYFSRHRSDVTVPSDYRWLPTDKHNFQRILGSRTLFSLHLRTNFSYFYALIFPLLLLAFCCVWKSPSVSIFRPSLTMTYSAISLSTHSSPSVPLHAIYANTCWLFADRFISSFSAFDAPSCELMIPVMAHVISQFTMHHENWLMWRLENYVRLIDVIEALEKIHSRKEANECALWQRRWRTQHS